MTARIRFVTVNSPFINIGPNQVPQPELVAGNVGIRLCLVPWFWQEPVAPDAAGGIRIPSWSKTVPLTAGIRNENLEYRKLYIA